MELVSRSSPDAFTLAVARNELVRNGYAPREHLLLPLFLYSPRIGAECTLICNRMDVARRAGRPCLRAKYRKKSGQTHREEPCSLKFSTLEGAGLRRWTRGLRAAVMDQAGSQVGSRAADGLINRRVELSRR